MKNSHESIYYLDPWFIAKEYEMRTGASLPSKVLKSSNSNFEASAAVFKGQLGSQESLEFDQTPEKIFWEISPQLEEYPEIEIAADMKIPPVFWVRGIFAPFGQTHKLTTTGKPEDTIDDVWAFSITPEGRDNFVIRLLTNGAHFRYNIEQLLEHPTTLGEYFRPRVRVLLKSHGQEHDNHCFLATPLVILETRPFMVD
jgi:hypothetical protein